MVAQAEAQARRIVAEAETRAKQMVAAAHSAPLCHTL